MRGLSSRNWIAATMRILEDKLVLLYGKNQINRAFAAILGTQQQETFYLEIKCTGYNINIKQDE